eukprot:567026-Pyramimonas_sp.AAC.1
MPWRCASRICMVRLSAASISARWAAPSAASAAACAPPACRSATACLSCVSRGPRSRTFTPPPPPLLTSPADSAVRVAWWRRPAPAEAFQRSQPRTSASCP